MNKKGKENRETKRSKNRNITKRKHKEKEEELPTQQLPSICYMLYVKKKKQQQNSEKISKSFQKICGYLTYFL
jgi:RNase P protein component